MRRVIDAPPVDENLFPINLNIVDDRERDEGVIELPGVSQARESAAAPFANTRKIALRVNPAGRADSDLANGPVESSLPEPPIPLAVPLNPDDLRVRFAMVEGEIQKLVV